MMMLKIVGQFTGYSVVMFEDCGHNWSVNRIIYKERLEENVTV